MKAYSVDLRERAADAVLLDGLTWAATARLFRLSVASVGRFVLARRRGRDLTPRHSSGRPPRLNSPEKLAALRAQLAAEPDLYQRALLLEDLAAAVPPEIAETVAMLPYAPGMVGWRVETYLPWSNRPGTRVLWQ